MDSLSIAQEASLEKIDKIADKLDLLIDEWEPKGRFKAKIKLSTLKRVAENKMGKYILVTAITPTPFGEGKTTMSIGLTQSFGSLGYKSTVTLRQPSLGPVFGIKGGAAGAGYSQVLPMEDINLHFTGDIHAVSAAHNLLSALIDNHIAKGNSLNLDITKIAWKRVVDMNDRALRKIVIGIGGSANGIPREDGFDITAASEIMAILALSTNYGDLKERLGNITIGYNQANERVNASDLKAHGAMAAVLKEAMMPNLVQTLEGQPAIIHAGPFANIAHGNCSIIADQISIRLSDFTITEAGFAADLGAEKFFDIKCRVSGLWPDAVVLVASIRALKLHGGAFNIRPGQKLPEAEVSKENLDAVRAGFQNLHRHVISLQYFGVPIVIAINKFSTDNDSEITLLKELVSELGVAGCEVSTAVVDGGKGSVELAKQLVEATSTSSTSPPKFVYELEDPVRDKIQKIATKIYGADGVSFSARALTVLKEIESDKELSRLPICMAKTHLSISDNPQLKGWPKDFTITIDDIRVATGARFIYPILGKMLTMPGLPARPSAEFIDMDSDGKIIGLF